MNQRFENNPGLLGFIFFSDEAPPYSPDLTDYFLWGYLKEMIYNNNPQTLPHLKAT